MQYRYLSLATLIAAASAQSTIYSVETVTENTTTAVTITQCSDHACETSVESVSYTTVTTTVDGVETVYTTVCPLTSTESESTATPVVEAVSTSSTAQPTVSGTESDEYVDITITPTVTASTGVDATITSQLTITSIYRSQSTSANGTVNAVATFEGKGNQQRVMMGAVGVAGLAAVLL